MSASTALRPVNGTARTMDVKSKHGSKLPKRASNKALVIPGGGGRVSGSGGRLAAAGFNPNVTVKLQDLVGITTSSSVTDANEPAEGAEGAAHTAAPDVSFDTVATAVINASSAPAPATSALSTTAKPPTPKGDSDALLAFSSRQAALAQAANRPKSSGGTRRTAQEEEDAENTAAVGTGRIRVFVRLRPVDEAEMARKGGNCCSIDGEDPNSVEVLEPSHRAGLDKKKFGFDRVLGPQTTNDEVFRMACRPLVDAVLNGFNGTLMAYGQTGTGKTYTMGSMASYSKTQGFQTGTEPGMIPRVVDYLFEKTGRDLTNEYQFKVAFVQIYQDEVYDLLSLEGDSGSGSNLMNSTTNFGSSVKLGSSLSLGSTFGRGKSGEDDPTRLQIRESPSRGAYIAGLTEVQVSSPTAVMEMLKRGQRKLVFAETKMNRQSSRSHAICFITTECVVPTEKATEGSIPRPTTLSAKGVGSASGDGSKSKSKGKGATQKGGGASKDEKKKQLKVRGKITLCDLAGSERVKKTGNVDGDRLAEAQHINSSLLELGNVVAALASKSKRSGEAAGSIHIPFRNSTLTRVLQDSLGGNCKTSLLICCSPFMRDQGETRGSMMFGARAMQIVQHARINVDLDYRHLANDLARQLEVKAVAWSTLEESLRRKIAKLEDEITDMADAQLKDNAAMTAAFEEREATAAAASQTASEALNAIHAVEIAKLKKKMKGMAVQQQAKDEAQKKKEGEAALANARAMAKQRKERKERQKMEGSKQSELVASNDDLNDKVGALEAALATVTEERQALLDRAAAAANEHADALAAAAAEHERTRTAAAKGHAQLDGQLADIVTERDELVGMTAGLTDKLEAAHSERDAAAAKLAEAEGKLQQHAANLEATEAEMEARLAGELEAKQEATISTMYTNLADLAADGTKEEQTAAITRAVEEAKAVAAEQLAIAVEDGVVMQNYAADMKAYATELEAQIETMHSQAADAAAASENELAARAAQQDQLAQGFKQEEAAARALQEETELLSQEIALLRARMPTVEFGVQTEAVNEGELKVPRKKKWLCF